MLCSDLVCLGYFLQFTKVLFETVHEVLETIKVRSRKQSCASKGANDFQNMTKFFPQRKQRLEVIGTSEKTCILHAFKISLV